jgi:hypothetical protein
MSAALGEPMPQHRQPMARTHAPPSAVARIEDSSDISPRRGRVDVALIERVQLV